MGLRLSRGALRYYFPAGRYDLLPAMVAFLIDKEAARLEAIGPMPATIRLRLALHSLVQHGRHHTPMAMFEVWMATRGDARLGKVVDPLFATIPERLHGMDPHGFANPELLALHLLVQGVAVQCSVADYDRHQVASAVEWLLSKLTPPKELREVLARIESL